MAHTFSKNYVHVIFGTKDRRKTARREASQGQKSRRKNKAGG